MFNRKIFIGWFHIMQKLANAGWLLKLRIHLTILKYLALSFSTLFQ